MMAAKSYDPAHYVAPSSMFTVKLARAFLELVAEGYTWREIKPKLDAKFGKDKVPSTIQPFYRWAAKYEDFGDAYEEARRISARSYEDKALEKAADLTTPGAEYTGVGVRAAEVAMGQWRWSAAKRDRSRFAETNTPVSQVAISISTPLNLGQEGGGGGNKTLSVYERAAQIGKIEDAEAVPVEDTPKVNPFLPASETGLDDKDADMVKLMARNITPRLPGRPRKRHKTPTQIKATQAAHKRRRNLIEKANANANEPLPSDHQSDGTGRGLIPTFRPGADDE